MIIQWKLVGLFIIYICFAIAMLLTVSDKVMEAIVKTILGW